MSRSISLLQREEKMYKAERKIDSEEIEFNDFTFMVRLEHKNQEGQWIPDPQGRKIRAKSGRADLDNGLLEVFAENGQSVGCISLTKKEDGYYLVLVERDVLHGKEVITIKELEDETKERTIE
jgi:hypothetical protein